MNPVKLRCRSGCKALGWRCLGDINELEQPFDHLAPNRGTITQANRARPRY